MSVVPTSVDSMSVVPMSVVSMSVVPMSVVSMSAVPMSVVVGCYQLFISILIISCICTFQSDRGWYN